MKVRAFVGLFWVAALLPAQNTATIEGVVVDAATGAGIGGATVVFAPGQLILTDAAGVFRATGVKPGDYSGYAQKQGYLGMAQLQFHVNADGIPARPRVELIPPASLRGRVFGIDGKPARVTVEFGPRYQARTDDEGYFTLDRLPPGSSTLLARPEPAEPVFTQDGLRTEPAPTYYPSILDRSQAQSITIRPGAELSGYEIRLQSSPVYRVSGIVLDPAGNPAPDAVVQLLDNAPEGFSGFSNGGLMFSIRRAAIADAHIAPLSTSTADDGTFEFSSVRPGDWTIRVESDTVRDEAHQQDVILFGSSAISVGARDLDDVQIRLGMPFDYSGAVDGGDEPSSIAHTVGVTLVGGTGFFGGTAKSDINGWLRFEGVIPGPYLISAASSGDYYAAVQLGSSDVTGQTVELTASSPLMRVVLKRGGTVRWTLDQPGLLTVVLLPQTLTGFGYFAATLNSSSQLTGIPPGEYYAIALDRFDLSTMADSPHLRRLVPLATSVRVQAGADTFVQLKINRSPD